jgi:hypothetical protein
MVARLTTLLDGLQAISALRAIRVAFDTANDSDNRLVASAIYDDKQSMDTADARVNEALSEMMEFIVGEPAVREGEIIWAFDADGVADKPVMPGYIRHTTVSFDPSKLDAFLAYADSTVGTLKSVSGLRRIRVATVKGPSQLYQSEDRINVTAGFDSKEAADAALEQNASIWAGMAEFMADDPERRIVAGDLIYAYSR